MIRNHLLILPSSWNNSINVPDKLCYRETTFFRFVSYIADSLLVCHCKNPNCSAGFCGLLLHKMFASSHVRYMLDKAKGMTGFEFELFSY